MKHIPWLILVFFIINSCSPKLTKHFLTLQDVEALPANYEKSTTGFKNNPCLKTLSYLPDTNHINHTPIKKIRVNFHWVNSSDSSKNYYGKKAIEFTKGLLHATNYDLRKNKKMYLPHNNNTPVLPILHRYELSPDPSKPNDTGIYFHFDDEVCYYVHKGKNRNIFRKDVIKRYGVRTDEVLNIFIMPHHPDSVKSKTYTPSGVGVALGNAIKVAGIAENGGSFWGYRGIINHEVGHIYGLSHTWAYNDGCDDTPHHSQKCWSRSQSPECATNTSNNIMDYNNQQNSWSPCQIAKVQYRMARETARSRKFLVPNWCTLNPERHIIIRDTIVWSCMKDLEGHLSIEDGGHLTMRCRTSVPKNGKITVAPGGTLVLENTRLHNACGDQWAGIEIQKLGRRQGRVIYIGNPKLENLENPIN